MGTSVAEIVQESGLSAGGIYGHFPGKDDIIIAAATEILEGRVERIRSATDHTPVPPPHEVLPEVVSTLGEGPDPGMVIQVWAYAVTHEDAGEVARALFTEVSGTIEDYLLAWYTQEDEPDPQVSAAATAMAVTAYVQGSIIQIALLGRSTEDLAEGLRRILG